MIIENNTSEDLELRVTRSGSQIDLVEYIAHGEIAFIDVPAGAVSLFLAYSSNGQVYLYSDDAVLSTGRRYEVEFDRNFLENFRVSEGYQIGSEDSDDTLTSPAGEFRAYCAHINVNSPVAWTFFNPNNNMSRATFFEGLGGVYCSEAGDLVLERRGSQMEAYRCEDYGSCSRDNSWDGTLQATGGDETVIQGRRYDRDYYDYVWSQGSYSPWRAVHIH
ncbi:hypothetical protein [Nioella sp. MMSF_3534]|uniref:hypothetical protein n=1 Tax=Nioella sp. MMSF_3534 TaxID=3046720 RepID=UPI00273DCE67|nr:hypothetical protein [Nioella sp. MMSF_3534]